MIKATVKQVYYCNKKPRIGFKYGVCLKREGYKK